jgi:hypothetical protein
MGQMGTFETFGASNSKLPGGSKIVDVRKMGELAKYGVFTDESKLPGSLTRWECG